MEGKKFEIKAVSRISRAGLKNGFSKEDYNLKIEKAKKLISESFINNKMSNSENVLLAIDLYKEAMNIDTSKSEPYTSIAYLCYSMGLIEDCFLWLNTAEKMFPLESEINELKLKILRRLQIN